MTSHTEFNENTPKSIWVALGLWFVTGSFGLWYTEKCNFLKAFIVWIVMVVLVFTPVLSYRCDKKEGRSFREYAGVLHIH